MAVRVTGDSAFRGLSPSGGQGRCRALTLRQRTAKRVLDVVASTILLVVMSPLMAVVAVLLLIVSKPPVLFRQARLGWHGEMVPMLKFRTMVVGAEDLRDALWSERLQLGSDSPPALFKLRDDPRVTRMGRVLRRWSIDELPQLWNVLQGDMSLVGPRPLTVVDHRAAAGVLGMEDRLLVRPGITGPWQVRGRSDLGVEDMVALDLDYVARWTFRRDVRLLAATVPAVLRGRGAY